MSDDSEHDAATQQDSDQQHSLDQESTSRVGEVLEQFKQYIDSRLDNLAGSLTPNKAHLNNQDEIHSSTKKLQRETDALKFKYKSNAKQFLHNAEIEDFATAIIDHLDSPNVGVALHAAKDALKQIKKRQKLIKLADKSEAGCLAVDEYESNELTNDSEDEKRIKKAQDKAIKRKKQLMQAKNKKPRLNPLGSTVEKPEDRKLFRGKPYLLCCLC